MQIKDLVEIYNRKKRIKHLCFLTRVMNFQNYNLSVITVCVKFFELYSQKVYERFEGAGGAVPDHGMVKIEFSIVLDRGESQLPDAFYRIKKY